MDSIEEVSQASFGAIFMFNYIVTAEHTFANRIIAFSPLSLICCVKRNIIIEYEQTKRAYRFGD